MRVTFLLCATVLLCLSVFEMASAASRQPNCEKYENKEMCSRELAPVCGDNGVTYNTECLLCKDANAKMNNVKIVAEGPCALD